MIDTLIVAKSYNHYADTFRMLGLAKLIADALGEIGKSPRIQLIDEGTQYRIQLHKAIDLDALSRISYFNPFTPVIGAKTNRDSIPAETSYFDVVAETEKRKLYREYLYQTGSKKQWTEETPPPPNAKTQNGAILVSLRHERNHNDLWMDSWKLKENFGELLLYTIQKFSTNPRKTNLSIPDQANAVKIYLPNTVQGVNRTKADTNTVGSQKAEWLDLWLIANGFFNFALAERIKIAEGTYDWRVVALEPKDISLKLYTTVLDELRSKNPPGGGHGVPRFDVELVIGICLKLLEKHSAKARDYPEDPDSFYDKPVNEFIGRFKGTHFNSKGQVYGVKDVFSLGLPYWIRPENYPELQEYIALLSEHLEVIKTLTVEEGHSDLLSSYRDFITGTTIRQFFPFQRRYADYVVRRLAEGKYTRLFTKQGLDTMTKNDIEVTKITTDLSFLRIARAINQATVYAGEVRTKEGTQRLEWDRNYGLAQLLSTQSGSKRDFIIAITDFLAKYEAENLRLQEKLLKQGKPLTRVWPKKEDIDRLLQIIEDNDHVLVANLLIAYGYASWAGEGKKDTNTPEEE
jgi:hypothetical protein